MPQCSAPAARRPASADEAEPASQVRALLLFFLKEHNVPTRDPKTPSNDPERHADVTRAQPRRPDRGVAPPAATEREHEGATEDEVGDRTGPGAGYDEEPAQEPDEGGVS
ncbi:MAG TPA: hypothetical protein VHB78_16350 [Vicinamibacterales bacterium]|jgi:hypothetical protein|nr:hypothetical protein [Vicinamibacterales bacterium]